MHPRPDPRFVGAETGATATPCSRSSRRPISSSTARDVGPDYDKTLMAWNDRFQRAWPSLGARHAPRFKRMWELYLLGFAGGFRVRTWQLWQIVLSKPGRAQPDCRRGCSCALRGVCARSARRTRARPTRADLRRSSPVWRVRETGRRGFARRRRLPRALPYLSRASRAAPTAPAPSCRRGRRKRRRQGGAGGGDAREGG
jgi:hypothetical protein